MRRELCLAALVLACGAGPAHADQVELTNGDRLTGKLVSLVKGTLTFKAELLGAVEIDAGRVRTLSTDEPIEVHLKNGAVLREPAAASDEIGAFRLADADGPVAIDDTLAINPPPEKVWSGSALVGAEINRGNHYSQEVDSEMTLMRRAGKNRTRLRVEYDTDRAKDSDGNKSTSDRQLISELQHDYFFREKSFVYGGIRAENNDPADLDLLLRSGTGIGYQWFDDDTTELSTEAGLAWVEKRFKDDTNDEAYLGGALKWRLRQQLTKRTSLFSNGEWTPSLKDRDNQIVETNNGIRSDLPGNFFIEAKIEWDWDSAPAEDAKRQDVEYTLSLGYKF